MILLPKCQVPIRPWLNEGRIMATGCMKAESPFHLAFRVINGPGSRFRVEKKPAVTAGFVSGD